MGKTGYTGQGVRATKRSDEPVEGDTGTRDLGESGEVYPKSKTQGL